MASYRIAYLNPYPGRAEDQSFQSLRIAAEAMGLALVQMAPEALTEDDPFDFVVSITSETPKLTSHPTYLSAHGGRRVYLHDERLFANTLTYDGYLCISDSLVRFFSTLSSALGHRVASPGHFYLSPQKLPGRADLRALAHEGLELCYFGTNWDRRSEPLYRRLAADRQDVRFYGPAGSWDHIDPRAYKGAAPFDGWSVQEEYRRFGAGFVSLSEFHLFDDVISNRLFEIASVSACAICPDTDWIRRHFGDNVFYYPAFSEPDAVLSAVDRAMRAIRADPDAAVARADRARTIFETDFAADRMLANLVGYHEDWMAGRAGPQPSPEADLWKTAEPPVVVEREAALLRAIPEAVSAPSPLVALQPLAHDLWQAKLDVIADLLRARSGRLRLPLERGELTTQTVEAAEPLIQALPAEPEKSETDQQSFDLSGWRRFDGEAYLVLDLDGRGGRLQVTVEDGAGDILATDVIPAYGGALEIWVRTPRAGAARRLAVRLLDGQAPVVERLRAIQRPGVLGAPADGAKLLAAYLERYAPGRIIGSGAAAVLGEPAESHAPATVALPMDTVRPTPDGQLDISSGEAPWAFVANLPLASFGALEVQFSAVTDDLFLMLIDESYQPVGERMAAPPGSEPGACWFRPGEGERPVALVVQAGPQPRLFGGLRLDLLRTYPAGPGQGA